VLGKGKSTKYKLSQSYELMHTIDVDLYFRQEIDERVIKNSFNHLLMPDVLSQRAIFTNAELNVLATLQKQHTKTFQN
jgi:hypothetical protein